MCVSPQLLFVRSTLENSAVVFGVSSVQQCTIARLWLTPLALMTEPHYFHDKHNTKNVVRRDQMSASERHGVSVNKAVAHVRKVREHVHH